MATKDLLVESKASRFDSTTKFLTCYLQLACVRCGYRKKSVSPGHCLVSPHETPVISANLLLECGGQVCVSTLLPQWWLIHKCPGRSSIFHCTLPKSNLENIKGRSTPEVSNLLLPKSHYTTWWLVGEQQKELNDAVGLNCSHLDLLWWESKNQSSVSVGKGHQQQVCV